MTRYLASCSLEEFLLPSLTDAQKNEGQEQAYLIAILDGSDSFAESHGRKQSEHKETLHREVCECAIAELKGRLLPTGNRFRDAALGIFSGDDALHRAVASAVAIHRNLSLWNAEHGLGWIEQAHSRIGISMESWPESLLLAQQAQRGETLLLHGDLERLTSRELLLLKPGLAVRSGAAQEDWEEVLQEAEQGIEPLPSDATRAKQVQRFLQQHDPDARREARERARA